MMCKYNSIVKKHFEIAYLLQLIILLCSCSTNKAPTFVFNVKGLTAQDRVQWEKDNIEELYKLGYTSWDDNRKDRYFRNSSFKNKFGNRPDYELYKSMSPEKRDSLFLSVPEDVEKMTKYNNLSIRTSHMEYLNVEDFYCKSALILVCGIVFIYVLGILARHSSSTSLIVSKKRRIIGNILILIGTFSFLWGVVMFLSCSYPKNVLTEYGYSIINSYNHSIIRPSSIKLLWGYNTQFLSGVFSLFYGGICLFAWGNYIRYYQKSTVSTWKKTCKTLGYILLTITFWNCSEFHYFDIWEFIPKLLLLGLSVFLISIGTEKVTHINHGSETIPKITFKDSHRTTWINNSAHSLYRYIKATIVFDIIVALILISDLLDTVGGEVLGTILIVETLVKNSMMLIYLKKKATQVYSEDYLVPQWFKSKFYKYLNDKAELRVILLFLYLPLFYIIPLPFGTCVIVFYTIPVCILTGAYLGYKWIKAGKHKPIS